VHNKSSNGDKKSRGRPRLYAVNPATGKSIKGHLINNNTSSSPSSSSSTPTVNSSLCLVQQSNGTTNTTTSLPIHLITTPNGLAIYPSPSTSTSSQYSTSTSTNNSNTIIIPSQNIQIQPQQSQSATLPLPPPPPPPIQQQQQLLSSSSLDKQPQQSDSSMDEDQSETTSESTSSEMSDSEMDVSTSSPQKVLKEVNNQEKQPQATKKSTLLKPIAQNNVILTHVIEGFVIKESGQPFPVKSTSNTNQIASMPETSPESCHKNSPKQTSTPSAEPTTTTTTSMITSNNNNNNNNETQNSSASKKDHMGCMECGGKTRLSTSTGESKKFCSSQCKKRFIKKTSHETTLGLRSNKDRLKTIDMEEQQQRHRHHQHKKRKHSHHHHHHHHRHSSSSPSVAKKQKSSTTNSSSPLKQTSVSLFNETNNDNNTTNSSILLPPPPPPLLNPFITNQSNSNSTGSGEYPLGDPAEWNCEQVFEFVKQVTGTIQVAQLFRSQEVDGSALSLIRDDHLVNTMQIKLGPALKIMSKFNELTQKFHTQSKTTNVSQQQQQQQQQQPMLMLPITQIHA
jgi:hypothetical protein